MLRSCFVLPRSSIVQLESSVSAGHFLSLSCDCFPGTDLSVHISISLCSTCPEINVSANMSTFGSPKNPDWHKLILWCTSSGRILPETFKCMDLVFFWDLRVYSQTCTLQACFVMGLYTNGLYFRTSVNLPLHSQRIYVVYRCFVF